MSSLTEEQKKTIEAKKKLAIERRKKRQAEKESVKDQPPSKKPTSNQQIDTGAGFFIEDDEDDLVLSSLPLTHEAAPLIDPSSLMCDHCGAEFIDSYLLRYFDFTVCDNCKGEEEKYDLITKTDARSNYLLKDSDFDRGKPLKFISKKNPHHQSWGEMKLFLKCQVEKRCLEIWESMEKVEEEKEKRQQVKEVTKQKKFDKKVKDLRMAVRSSLWTKDTRVHEHEYGDEQYDEDEDEYSKTCSSCGHVMNYEKM